MRIELIINGEKKRLESEPLGRLLDIIRTDLGLTGTKEGCGEGECGACSVLLDGKLVNSCLIPAAQCNGASITTIEGYALTERGKVLTSAFAQAHGVQCGFCTPAMILAAESLLQINPKPNEIEIRKALSGNICRCTGYDMIIDAVRLASKKGDGLW